MSETTDNPQGEVLNMALDKIETLTAELAELANSTTSDHTAAKYWKQRQDARNETKRVTVERDSALASIAEALSWLKDAHVYNSSDAGHVVSEVVRDEAVDALEQSPTVALAKVKAGALRDAADSRNGEVKDWLNWRAEQIEKGNQ